jgi:hypothetical protein
VALRGRRFGYARDANGCRSHGDYDIRAASRARGKYPRMVKKLKRTKEWIAVASLLAEARELGRRVAKRISAVPA